MKEDQDRLYNVAAILAAATISKLGALSSKEVAEEFGATLKALVESKPEDAFNAGLDTLRKRKITP